jgi:hypothetical protein
LNSKDKDLRVRIGAKTESAAATIKMVILQKGNSKEGLKRSAAEKTVHFSPKGMIIEEEEAAMPIGQGNHVNRKTGKGVRRENQLRLRNQKGAQQPETETNRSSRNCYEQSKQEKDSKIRLSGVRRSEKL